MLEVGLLYALICGDVSSEYKAACLKATRATSMQTQIHQKLEQTRSKVLTEVRAQAKSISKPIIKSVTDITGKGIWAVSATAYSLIKGKTIIVIIPKKWHGEFIDSIDVGIQKSRISTNFRWHF